MGGGYHVFEYPLWNKQYRSTYLTISNSTNIMLFSNLNSLPGEETGLLNYVASHVSNHHCFAPTIMPLSFSSFFKKRSLA